MNPGLGVLLLIVTVINLTNSHVRDYYAALGIGMAGMYVMAVLRVALAAALIFGRDKRVAMALRAAFFLGALAFTLLPTMEKALAYPIGAVAAAVLYRLTPRQEWVPAPKSATFAGIAGFARQGAQTFGLLFATSGAMCLAMLAVRAGLCGDSPIVRLVGGAFGRLDTQSVLSMAAIMWMLAAGLVLRATQRVTAMLLCVWALAAAGTQLASGDTHFLPGSLAWAAVFGGICSALPQQENQDMPLYDAGTLGCFGLALLLAFVGMWDLTSVRAGDAFAQAGYPSGSAACLGGVYFAASVMLCLPASRRWALVGVAAFSLAFGAIGVMHGGVAEAPLTVFTLALCVGLLAAVTPRDGAPVGRLVGG